MNKEDNNTSTRWYFSSSNSGAVKSNRKIVHNIWRSLITSGSPYVNDDSESSWDEDSDDDSK